MEYIILIISVFTFLVAFLSYLTARKTNNDLMNNSLDDELSREVKEAIREMEQSLANVEHNEQEISRRHAEELNSLTNRLISEKLDNMNSSFTKMLAVNKESNKEFLEGNATTIKNGIELMLKSTETRLTILTDSINKNFAKMREENNAQIEAIRLTMSERLDKTLNEQFEKSFRGVITQMGDLQKSMGELKGISTQVGSLEKTLSGVKTRGIMGEVQLKQIIQDVLSPSLYDVECPTRPGSSEHVEIAIKLPEKDSDRHIYLPIDSKCHLDRYEQLLDAYESCDPDRINVAKKQLESAIRSDAKDIYTKYVEPPYTTSYAILFVPFEGMYSEIVNLNLIDELNKMHITVAGPYTLTAILSTVTNYFQSLAIEKKSAEIEKTLAGVKSAFGKFDEMLGTVKGNLETASRNLDKLQTTRVNVINRALRNITESDSDPLQLTE